MAQGEGMNPNNPNEFSQAWRNLDATEIRQAFEGDQDSHKPAKYPYQIINGQLVRVDGQSTQETQPE